MADRSWLVVGCFGLTCAMLLAPTGVADHEPMPTIPEIGRDCPPLGSGWINEPEKTLEACRRGVGP